jgi:alpha-amylase
MKLIKQCFSRLLLLSVGIILLSKGASAGVLMQAFYWDLPSPVAGTATAPFWWDNLAGKANEFKKAGFTAVWLPPALKGASGGYSMGYDPYDEYDLGNKNQMFSFPTRFGSREQLQRTCAMMRANSLDIYLDIVLNHRNGDPGNFVFQYKNAYDVWGQGRYQKSSTDFTPASAQDPGVFDDSASFGRNVVYYNGGGAGNVTAYNYTNMLAANDWLTKALDVQGYRFDYAKGVSTNFLVAYLNYGAMANKFSVGEFWDGDVNYVQSWVTAVQNKSTAFDFPLRFMLQNMCNSNGSFNMASLDHAGLTGVNPLGSVTFVENHDTDHNAGQAIISNKMLAYAYILTSEGYPTVFYKDWSTEPGCYGLKTKINNLVWVHEKIAAGTTQERWKDGDVFAYERLGGSKLLVGLSDNGGSSRTITVQTSFGNNVSLHDYTGNAPDIFTNGSGQATITIPANINGNGYVAYSVQGLGGTVFTAPQVATTQEFAGATDLDIKPADNTALVQVARIWAQQGKPISAQLYFDNASWTTNTSIYLELSGPTNQVVGSRSYLTGTAQGTALAYTPTRTGWHTFKIRSFNTPAANLKPKYWLKTTYTAPQL